MLLARSGNEVGKGTCSLPHSEEATAIYVGLFLGPSSLCLSGRDLGKLGTVDAHPETAINEMDDKHG